MAETRPRADAEVILETSRLRLRKEAEGDQAIWLEHMNTPQVMANMGGPRTAEQIAKTFLWKAEGWARNGYSFMLVERKSDGLLIGHCGLAPIDAESAPPTLKGQPQIGWTLRADCWGQGYATESARGVLDYAFDTLGQSTVYGQTSQSNVGSWRLMERLKMERLADLDYVDPDYPAADNPTKIYAITHADWRAQQEPMAS